MKSICGRQQRVALADLKQGFAENNAEGVTGLLQKSIRAKEPPAETPQAYSQPGLGMRVGTGVAGWYLTKALSKQGQHIHRLGNKLWGPIQPQLRKQHPI